MNHPNKKTCLDRQNHHGFTLVEMLLVLVILSTLAAIIYPSIARHGLEARKTATRVQIKTLRVALGNYEVDNDCYPRGQDGLLSLIRRPTDARNWHGPYMDEKVIPKDAWGRDFTYECPGRENPESYDIVSAGPDGVEGTEDDITSWQTN
jgi:general secretion pathway protein G